MKKIFLASLLAVLSIRTTYAGDKSPEARFNALDDATQLYVQTCFAHYFSHVDFHARYDHADDAVPMKGGQADYFLRGYKGAAWGMKEHGAAYALILMDNGICALNAQKPVAGIWDNFEKVLHLMFPGAELVPVSPDMAGPQGDGIRNKGYQLKAHGRVLPPVFSLSVSTNPKLHYADRLTLFFPNGTAPGEGGSQ